MKTVKLKVNQVNINLSNGIFYVTVIPEHFLTKILHHLRGECIIRWTRMYVA